MKELKFNLKQMVLKKEFYIAILTVLLINIIQLFLTIQLNLSFNNPVELLRNAEYQIILNNYEVSFFLTYLFIVPIIVSLVFSTSNWDENDKKITNILYTRTDYKKNILIRLFLSILISFLITFVCTLLNYLAIRFIFISGSNFTSYQELPFNLFKDNIYYIFNEIRLTNVTLYAVMIIFHVSAIIGLISGICYSLSFFIRQKIIIYFIPLLLIIGSELLAFVTGLDWLSLARHIQLMNGITYNNIFLVYSGLIILCLIPIIKTIKNKEHII